MSEENRGTHKLYEKDRIGEVQIADVDYGIPTVNGLAFLSGEHKEEAFQELIKIIKNR